MDGLVDAFDRLDLILKYGILFEFVLLFSASTSERKEHSFSISYSYSSRALRNLGVGTPAQLGSDQGMVFLFYVWRER